MASVWSVVRKALPRGLWIVIQSPKLQPCGRLKNRICNPTNTSIKMAKPFFWNLDTLMEFAKEACPHLMFQEDVLVSCQAMLSEANSSGVCWPQGIGRYIVDKGLPSLQFNIIVNVPYCNHSVLSGRVYPVHSWLAFHAKNEYEKLCSSDPQYAVADLPDKGEERMGWQFYGQRYILHWKQIAGCTETDCGMQSLLYHLNNTGRSGLNVI
ncbi:hypothetical protein BDN70DRAFT_902336, partial [Pholiota conissans]